MTMIKLETDRLILRQWQDSDLAAFAKMSSDPEVMRYFPNTLSLEQSDALAEKIRGKIQNSGYGFWAVEIEETADFAGFCGLNIPDPQLPFGPSVEIGWRLAKHFWKWGYATEAATAAINYGFKELSLSEIVSFTVPSNVPSQNVMKRLGFQFDTTFEHPALPHGHPLREHVLYRLPKTQWFGQ